MVRRSSATRRVRCAASQFCNPHKSARADLKVGPYGIPMKRIYLSPPDVGASERQLLLDAFDSGWIAPLGPHVDAFERELAEYLGVPYAVALSSGTAALHLALEIVGVRAGQDVITSTLTFAATANAIRYVGANPVFLDVAESTWTIDPALLE